MVRVATKPLDEEAVTKANDDFYTRHPELIEDGERVPLDPCNPAHDSLRTEWMDLYIANGGSYYYGKFTPPCDDPIVPCTDKGNLMVQVVDERGNPLEDVLVELIGFESGRTWDNGWYDFGQLLAPAPYNLRVRKDGYEPDPLWDSAALMPCENHVVLVVLNGPEKDDDVRGMHSPACLRAQEEDPGMKELVEWVSDLIDRAYSLGHIEAARALHHYMGGTGTFMEIPEDVADEVEARSWSYHRDEVVEIIKGPLGAKGKIALKLVENVSITNPPETRVKPEADWPWDVNAEFDRSSAKAETTWSIAEDTDRALAYYGSVLRSIVKVRCSRYDPSLPRYLCHIEDWKTWVVDNYDWEGEGKGKKYELAGYRPFPTQSQMNRLQKVGCARAYRRSSRSWKVRYWSKGTPNYVGAWVVEFTDEEDVRLAAVNRAHFDRVNEDQRRRDKKAGALPYPPPAEEM